LIEGYGLIEYGCLQEIFKRKSVNALKCTKRGNSNLNVSLYIRFTKVDILLMVKKRISLGTIFLQTFSSNLQKGFQNQRISFSPFPTIYDTYQYIFGNLSYLVSKQLWQKFHILVNNVESRLEY